VRKLHVPYRPVFESHYRELLKFLAQKVASREDAADLAQESYVRVLTMARGGKTIADPRALLYRIARNLLVDRHRAVRVRDHDALDALAEADLPPAPQQDEPEQLCAATQAARAYVRTIESLSPRTREAFVMHLYDGLPQSEIARRMGISRSMVEKHIVRGLMACRACRSALHDGDGYPDGQDRE